MVENTVHTVQNREDLDVETLKSKLNMTNKRQQIKFFLSSLIRKKLIEGLI